MNIKGQSALEYLMTYGWALIVVAVIIGILWYVTSGTTGGIVCQTNKNTFTVKPEFNIGPDAVQFSLKNGTGDTITLASDCVSATDGTYITEGVTPSVCAPLTVKSTENFTVKQLDGPASSGTVTNATVTIDYTTADGLSGKVIITCNGRV